MKTHLDWSAYQDAGMGDPYADIPKQGGNYAKAIAACINSKQCEAANTGVMCPSYKVTGNPHLSPGGRVRLLKAALAAEDGALAREAFNDPAVAQAMDSCVACKGCKRECEANVDMALIKSEYLAQVGGRKRFRLRNRLFAFTPRWLHRLPALRHLLSWTNRSRVLSWLAERVLGLSARAPLPVPAKQPLRELPAPPQGWTADETKQPVALWVDTFVRYFEPRVALDAARVLRHAGYDVALVTAAGERPPCCGRTFLAQGMIEQARFELQRLVDALSPHVEAGRVILGLEASCVLGLRDDAQGFGLGDSVRKLAPHVMMFEEFLSKQAVKGKLDLPLRSLRGAEKTLVHGHCHQKSAGALKSMRRVLKLIPDHDFEMVQSSCCGMAGTFGLEKEHQEMSTKMAELGLLQALRDHPERRLVTNGFSCRQQVQRHGFSPPVHLASLLARALPDPS